MCRIPSLTLMSSLPISATNPTRRSKSGCETLSNGLTAITVAAERYPTLWLNPCAARLAYIIRPHRTFVAKSDVLMMRRNMDFGTDARMITCPRKGTSDNAPLAPSISRAHTAAAYLERARDQRVFHFKQWRGALSADAVWLRYATRHGIADRVFKDVRSTARQERSVQRRTGTAITMRGPFWGPRLATAIKKFVKTA